VKTFNSFRKDYRKVLKWRHIVFGSLHISKENHLKKKKKKTRQENGNFSSERDINTSTLSHLVSENQKQSLVIRIVFHKEKGIK